MFDIFTLLIISMMFLAYYCYLLNNTDEVKALEPKGVWRWSFFYSVWREIKLEDVLYGRIQLKDKQSRRMLGMVRLFLVITIILGLLLIFVD